MDGLTLPSVHSVMFTKNCIDAEKTDLLNK